MDPLLFLQDLAVIILSASIGGYICRRIGLSSIVGYITAGLIVGTPEIVFPYVTDHERVSTIAQLGVVFLMFSIGLKFSLRRIRELGLRTVLATALTAFFVFSAARVAADVIGLSAPAGIALAAVFMGSSSAIISKLIDETGIGHDRHGQLALGITLLEDIVAVVMLAVLGSYIVIEGENAARHPIETVGLLLGFAVLVFVVGTLILPRVLRSFAFRGGSEPVSVLVAGVLLMLSLLAVHAGYSLALGAFLCGMVVAETRQKSLIERSFQGLKDIFLTIFFVTIGMMVNVQAIPGALKWILLGTAGALCGRTLAAFVSLLLVGEHPRTAFRAALCLTPLGEFSFIIAGVAVAGGLLSEAFQVAAVGTVLGTSLLSPLIASRGEYLSRFLAEGRIPTVDRAHVAYSQLWRMGAGDGRFGNLWRLLRKRLLQVSIELLLVSTVLIFTKDIFGWMSRSYPGVLSGPNAELVFWSGLAVACTVPLLAVWRNLSATAEILAEGVRGDEKTGEISRAFISVSLRIIFAFLLVVWIWNLLPTELPRALILGISAAISLPLSLLAWRRFVRIHSEIEWMLDENLKSTARASNKHLFDNWKDQGWDLSVREFTLPDGSPLGGTTLRDAKIRSATGASVVGVQRHGYSLAAVTPTTHLFPGDEILLLGNQQQLKKALDLLGRTSSPEGTQGTLQNQIMKSLKVPEESPIAGKRLEGLNWPRHYGVQIIAIMREGVTVTAIDGKSEVRASDSLLLLGSSSQMSEIADLAAVGRGQK